MGLLFFKVIFKVSDITIVIISVFSYGITAIPFAFATNTSMLISNILGFFSLLGAPVMISMVTMFVEPDEVGKLNLYTFLNLSKP